MLCCSHECSLLTEEKMHFNTVIRTAVALLYKIDIIMQLKKGDRKSTVVKSPHLLSSSNLTCCWSKKAELARRTSVNVIAPELLSLDYTTGVGGV